MDVWPAFESLHGWNPSFLLRARFASTSPSSCLLCAVCVHSAHLFLICVCLESADPRFTPGGSSPRGWSPFDTHRVGLAGPCPRLARVRLPCWACVRSAMFPPMPRLTSCLRHPDQPCAVSVGSVQIVSTTCDVCMLLMAYVCPSRLLYLVGPLSGLYTARVCSTGIASDLLGATRLARLVSAHIISSRWIYTGRSVPARRESYLHPLTRFGSFRLLIYLCLICLAWV